MIRLNVFFTLKDEVSLDEVKAITDELVAKSRRIQDVIALIDEKTMRWLELSEFA